MASLGRVLSLKSGLVVQRGLSAPNPVKAVYSSSLSFRQIRNSDLKRENDEFSKEGNNTATFVKYKEAEAVKGFENSRLATSESTTSNDEAVYSTQSSPTPYGLSTRFGKSLPWHSLLSLLKPKINIQQLRYSSNEMDCAAKSKECNKGITECKNDKKNCNICVANCCEQPKCDAKTEECKPHITSLDLPMPCLKKTKPPIPCKIPKQQRWTCCDRSMCLPCCCPITKPLRCKIFDVTLNTCPRKTYRIASYSECSKRYGRKRKIKECCYHRRICYARNIADREIKPLFHIKDRQALALGFGLKTACRNPCS